MQEKAHGFSRVDESVTSETNHNSTALLQS